MEFKCFICIACKMELIVVFYPAATITSENSFLSAQSFEEEYCYSCYDGDVFKLKTQNGEILGLGTTQLHWTVVVYTAHHFLFKHTPLTRPTKSPSYRLPREYKPITHHRLVRNFFCDLSWPFFLHRTLPFHSPLPHFMILLTIIESKFRVHWNIVHYNLYEVQWDKLCWSTSDSCT